jgi:hypothetical protein
MLSAVVGETETEREPTDRQPCSRPRRDRSEDYLVISDRQQLKTTFDSAADLYQQAPA